MKKKQTSKRNTIKIGPVKFQFRFGAGGRFIG